MRNTDIKKLVQLHKKGELSNLYEADDGRDCSWRFIDKNFNSRPVSHGACHGGTRSSVRGNDLAVVTLTLERNINPSLDYYPGLIKWYDWILNKSIWRDAFLCKDAEHSLKYGFLKRVDIPGSYFLGAAQMCRMSSSELKNKLPIIAKMVLEDYDIPYSVLTFILVNWGVCADDNGILKVKPEVTKDIVGQAARSGVLKFYQVDHWPFDNSFSRLTLGRMIQNDLIIVPPEYKNKKIQFKIGNYYKPESEFRKLHEWQPRTHLLPYLRGEETPSSFERKSNAYSLDNQQFCDCLRYLFTEEPMSHIPNYQSNKSHKTLWPSAVKRLYSVTETNSNSNQTKKQLYINFGVIEEYISNVIFEMRKQNKLQ